MSNWKWIGSALVAIIALALFTGAVAIAGQTVTQRDGTVDLDNRVDLEDADDGYIDGIDIAAETISVTKTVNPPDGHSFKEFDEPLSGSGTKTRVDILPSSLTGCTASRGPESGSSITVEWEYPKDSFSEDPCYFPFALDGNLETGGIGGTGGSNGEGDGEAHWAVKMTDFTGSVAITQVPKYLFANATAAIPVKRACNNN